MINITLDNYLIIAENTLQLINYNVQHKFTAHSIKYGFLLNWVRTENPCPVYLTYFMWLHGRCQKIVLEMTGETHLTADID